VILITLRVIVYCWSYINDEQIHWRFIGLVLLFVLRILILIVGGNLLSLVLGWDGLGLRSYFLVIYYQNVKSNLSGFITVVRNRIGDVFVVLFIVLMLIDGVTIFWFKRIADFSLPALLGLGVLLRAITKSALFPYCTWLPEAIAAPTPVSSLVHSSTLVTAGIYFLIRYFSSMPFFVLGMWLSGNSGAQNSPTNLTKHTTNFISS
jgi:NADH-ubiquinone oxidoreductase chain 5